MIKIVPYSSDYKTLKKISKISNGLLYSSFFISLLSILNENNPIKTNILDCNWSSLFNIILSGISVFYLLVDVIQNNIFLKSEQKRYNDFIDNSLGTVLSHKKSEGYFNNNLPHSLTKLGANCFESSFFSKEISGKMISKSVIKTILVLILYFTLSFCLSKNSFASFLQIALPITIIIQTYKLIFYHYRISGIFEKFKLIFSSVNKELIDIQLLTNVINYERTLSWACVDLDSDIYDKVNPELTIEWEEIKKQLKIE